MKNKKTEDYVKPLLVLFFVFLILVQGISFYLQTKETLRVYNESVSNTQTHYAMQAAMTSRSLLEVTELLAQRYANELIQIATSAEGSQAAIEKLNQVLDQSLQSEFHDFLVFDMGGQMLHAHKHVMTLSEETRSVLHSINAFRFNHSNKPPIFV